MNNLADNLRKLLTIANISERELSRRTGIVHTVIHRILNNKSSNPTLNTLQAISEYFVITVSELLGDMPNHDGKQAYNHLGWRNIPILSKGKINFWLEGKTLENKRVRTIPVDFEPNKKVFGFKLTCDALKPIFCCNDIVVIDPRNKPSPSSYVIFWDSAHEVKIGKLRIDNNQDYLISFFNKSEEIKLDKSLLIGQIIQVTKSL